MLFPLWFVDFFLLILRSIKYIILQDDKSYSYKILCGIIRMKKLGSFILE